MNKKQRYTVKNVYGIAGESTHHKPERALAERDRREGEGWIVIDNNGDRFDYDFNGNIVTIGITGDIT